MFNLGHWLRMRKFRKNFLSVIVTIQDSPLIKDVLKNQPVDIFYMGPVVMVLVGSTIDVDKRTDAKDEIPFQIFYILVKKNIAKPKEVKGIVLETLKKTLSYRWCYSSKMLHELEG